MVVLFHFLPAELRLVATTCTSPPFFLSHYHSWPACHLFCCQDVAGAVSSMTGALKGAASGAAQGDELARAIARVKVGQGCGGVL